MNSKKLTVIVLFIFTVLIALLAIYLLATLNSKKITTLTPTPTITVTPSTDNVDTTSTPAACGESCTGTDCESGSSCIVVEGFRRCVSDSCINKETGNVTQYDVCDPNFCALNETVTPTESVTLTATPTVTATPTPTQATITPTASELVTINKSSALVCQAGITNKLLTVTITVTSNVSSDQTISIMDDLSNSLNTNLVKDGSISGDGISQANGVFWQDQELAAGSTLTLSYQMLLPAAEVGKTYTNLVTVSENSNSIATNNNNVTLNVLPCTDLRSDQIVMVAAGFLLMLMGMLAFRLNWHVSLGEYLWDHALSTSAMFAGGLKTRISIWYRDQKLDPQTRFENKFRGRKVSDPD